MLTEILKGVKYHTISFLIHNPYLLNCCDTITTRFTYIEHSMHNKTNNGYQIMAIYYSYSDTTRIFH